MYSPKYWHSRLYIKLTRLYSREWKENKILSHCFLFPFSPPSQIKLFRCDRTATFCMILFSFCTLSLRLEEVWKDKRNWGWGEGDLRFCYLYHFVHQCVSNVLACLGELVILYLTAGSTVKALSNSRLH